MITSIPKRSTKVIQKNPIFKKESSKIKPPITPILQNRRPETKKIIETKKPFNSGSSGVVTRLRSSVSSNSGYRPARIVSPMQGVVQDSESGRIRGRKQPVLDSNASKSEGPISVFSSRPVMKQNFKTPLKAPVDNFANSFIKKSISKSKLNTPIQNVKSNINPNAAKSLNQSSRKINKDIVISNPRLLKDKYSKSVNKLSATTVTPSISKSKPRSNRNSIIKNNKANKSQNTSLYSHIVNNKTSNITGNKNFKSTNSQSKTLGANYVLSVKHSIPKSKPIKSDFISRRDRPLI